MLHTAAVAASTMKQTLLLAFLTGATSLCLAHGDWSPKHGGILSVGGEITFELVRRSSEAILYVEDHGEFVSTSGAIGTLDVYRGDGTQTVELIGAGGNTLVARGVQFASGDRVRVRAMLPNRTMLIGRFVVE